MILDTPCELRSNSSTRSRNGRVPAFELLRSPTTRPSSVGTRLANGTAFSVTAPTGASNSIVAICAIPPFLSARQQLRGRGIFESLEFKGVSRGIGQEHDRLLVSALATDSRLVGLDTPGDWCRVAPKMSDEMVPEEVEVHARVGDEAFGTAEQATKERARFGDVADGERQVKGRCRGHASPPVERLAPG